MADKQLPSGEFSPILKGLWKTILSYIKINVILLGKLKITNFVSKIAVRHTNGYTNDILLD